MDSPIGRTIGRYQIKSELGRGGMGVVYRALDTTLHRDVALKILPGNVVADPDRRQRLLKEAQTTSRLEHPNIGVIHEVGEADGVSFIAMELIRGESLAVVLARGAMPLGRALGLATEIAEGLARAHEMGIVHRDLKPGNVMVTDDGHAKIIDFGLAKLVEPDGPGADALTAKASTAIGTIKGTAAYMSPEQTRGDRLDARTDLFSFGVMLYQMVSGRLPFDAPSYIDTLHAIVHKPAPPVAWSPGIVPEPVQADAQRLVEKCLAKTPDARYQTARALVVDLRAVSRRLDGSTTSALPISNAPVARGLTIGRPAIGAAVLVLFVAAAGVLWWTRRPPPPPPPVDASGRPSIAVLYFQNNTGSPDLDWLRKGLTDMLVTDLSQGRGVEVLSTERLYQILAHLERQDDTALSFETVKDVARLAGVRHVLTGSYIKSGNIIRIDATLQDAMSGQIVTARHVEANGDASLFPSLDTLTQALHASLVSSAGMPRDLMARPGAEAPTASNPFDLKDVTTSSMDAYKEYAAGIALIERARLRDAVPYLERAITLDPNFAQAMVRLAAVANNLRQPDRRDELSQRALALADRLTPRDRHYIEGFYYSTKEDGAPRAIAAYEKVLAIDPRHYTARGNLAFVHGIHEQFEDALRLHEELRRSEVTAVATFNNLVDGYTSLDRFDTAQAVVSDFERRFPGRGLSDRAQTSLLAAFGRLDEAKRAFERATAVSRDPSDVTTQWTFAMLEERWADAEGLSAEAQRSADPFTRLFGDASRYTRALYRGRSAEAFKALDRTLGPMTTAGATMASILALGGARSQLASGNPAAALALAERVGREAPSDAFIAPTASSRFLAARALARLGRAADVTPLMKAMEAAADADAGPRSKRRLLHLTGAMALDRGDAAGAVTALTQAEALLPARTSMGPPASQPPLWFDLGSALVAAGRDAEAARRFERLITGIERIHHPLEFVRSLYFLGQIAERRGDMPKARTYYQRFISYWGDGDLDRERVAHAKQVVGQ
jgi:serine/threonine protein kinase/tetratricopeptide (TPR) repeat protein